MDFIKFQAVMYCSRLSGSGWGGGGVDNSKGVGRNTVMTPYDNTVRAYLANIPLYKNAIDLGAKCTMGQGEIAEWRNSRNGIILITGLHIAIITSYCGFTYT